LFASASFAEEAKPPAAFGAEITLSESLTVDQAISQIDQIKEKDVLLAGKVTKVCQMKGCWMAFNSEVGPVRVTFKDYGFFVSEELVGKRVLAQGVMFEKTMSISEARHYAQDGGMSKEEIEKITEPVQEFRFVASAVKEISS
jgi:hypothetical protein